MIFIHFWLVSRPPKKLCPIFDLVLRLLGIFPHTLEDTALIVRPVIDPRECGHSVTDERTSLENNF